MNDLIVQMLESNQGFLGSSKSASNHGCDKTMSIDGLQDSSFMSKALTRLMQCSLVLSHYLPSYLG